MYNNISTGSSITVGQNGICIIREVKRMGMEVYELTVLDKNGLKTEEPSRVFMSEQGCMQAAARWLRGGK